jgi:hypothetical protein
MSFQVPNIQPNPMIQHTADTARLLGDVLRTLNGMSWDSKNLSAAMIASGIIAASGRPHSVAQAMEVLSVCPGSS